MKTWNCSSICSQMQSHNNINFLQQYDMIPKPSIPTNLQQKLNYFTKFQSKTHQIHLGKLHSSVSNFLQKPISNPPKVQSSLHKIFLKTTAEKIAFLLVGGLIFFASCCCKSVLALPTTQKTSISETMEENKDSQSENVDDDDEMYLRILDKNPRDIEVLKVVLSKKMMKGKTKEAIEFVEKLIEVEPDEVEWSLLQALLHEMVGNLSRAKRLFKDILAERPLSLRALHGLAMVMHRNLEGPAVFDMLYKALELAQRDKRVTEERSIRILIAQMHVVKGELEEGLKKFIDLVDDNPRDFRPYLCQGIIYSLLNKKKEADEQFETYGSLVPQEFPQRGFLDDVVMSAKTKSREQLDADFSYKKMKTN